MPKFERVGKEDAMVTLCRMVVETRYEDIPENVVDFAKKLILDVLGITIAGSSQEAITEVVELVKEYGGKEESLIPFYGIRVPASMAAFAIGPMSRALDMGDTHEMAGHTSEYVFPTLLAAIGMKKKVSGKEFITALIVGVEVLTRIGEASKAVEHLKVTDQGGQFIFGEIAAVGKLLNLNLEELQNAMGMGVHMTQPHSTLMYIESSDMQRVHHGFIGQDAINICRLAQKGLTGAHNILLGSNGYLKLYDKVGTDEDKLFIDLGEKWRAASTMIKPYASCKFTHAAIYALLQLMDEHNFVAEDIDMIHINVSSQGMSVVVNPKDKKWNPHTTLDCQFSLPYTVATAAFDKRVFLDSYTEEAKVRKNVRNLMARITVEEDKNLPVWVARVNVKCKDGRKLKKESIYVKGHEKNPFTKEEIIEKFKWMIPYSAYELNDDIVNSLIESVLNLEDVEDVEENIIAPLT